MIMILYTHTRGGKFYDYISREGYNDLHFNFNGVRYHKISEIHYKEV